MHLGLGFGIAILILMNLRLLSPVKKISQNLQKVLSVLELAIFLRHTLWSEEM